MSHSLLIVLVLAGAARAERLIDVDATGAPFEARELEAALRVRMAVSGAPVHVRVTSTDGGVEVEVHGSVREVDLLGRRGADAARLVALATDDLMLDDLATVPALARPARPTLALLGGVMAWEGTLGGATLDLAVPGEVFVAALEVGVARPTGGALDLTAGVVRASVGVHGRWYELRGGLTAMPVLVTTGVGDRTVLAGVGASGRAFVPFTRGVRAVLAAGVDAFATRTEYRLPGMTVMTPGVAPWLALGLEADL